MSGKTHFQSLIGMYAAAPVNEIHGPRMTLSEGQAEIETALSEKLHSSAGGAPPGSTWRGTR